MMWVAGLLAAMSTIIYPSISSLVSKNADPDQQGGLHHNEVINNDVIVCVSVWLLRTILYKCAKTNVVYIGSQNFDCSIRVFWT